MHGRRTPTNLLDGQLWAGWGPPVDDRPDLARSSLLVELVARLTRRKHAQVEEILAHSRDRGRYLLLRKLSVTKHAAVYSGVDRNLAREVAIKIHRDVGQDARVQAIRESQAMARLEHPNIVQIHDVGEHVHQVSEGEHGTWLYSVLELCDCDLFEWCVRNTPDWTEIVARIIQAGHGLAYLHGAGYTHRDIKPANILIVRGVAKLADFGFVARPGPKLRLVGTAGFIAPDAAVYGPSYAADVFALAVSLWSCLFGELPYTLPSGSNVTPDIAANAAIQKCLDREIAPPRVSPPGLPESVRELVERALDPEPKRRPCLEQFLFELKVELEQFERRKQLRRWVPAFAAGVFVIFGVGFAIGAVRNQGTGSGSPTDAVLGAFDPLTRAEIAALMGKGDMAIGAIYLAYDAAENLPESERIEVAKTAERVAQMLETTGQWADALEALAFAVRIYERTGRIREEAAARAALGQLLKADLD